MLVSSNKGKVPHCVKQAYKLKYNVLLFSSFLNLSLMMFVEIL